MQGEVWRARRMDRRSEFRDNSFAASDTQKLARLRYRLKIDSFGQRRTRNINLGLCSSRTSQILEIGI